MLGVNMAAADTWNLPGENTGAPGGGAALKLGLGGTCGATEGLGATGGGVLGATALKVGLGTTKGDDDFTGSGFGDTAGEGRGEVVARVVAPGRCSCMTASEVLRCVVDDVSTDMPPLKLSQVMIVSTGMMTSPSTTLISPPPLVVVLTEVVSSLLTKVCFLSPTSCSTKMSCVTRLCVLPSS